MDVEWLVLPDGRLKPLTEHESLLVDLAAALEDFHHVAEAKARLTDALEFLLIGRN